MPGGVGSSGPGGEGTGSCLCGCSWWRPTPPSPSGGSRQGHLVQLPPPAHQLCPCSPEGRDSPRVAWGRDRALGWGLTAEVSCQTWRLSPRDRKPERTDSVPPPDLAGPCRVEQLPKALGRVSLPPGTLGHWVGAFVGGWAACGGVGAILCPVQEELAPGGCSCLRPHRGWVGDPLPQSPWRGWRSPDGHRRVSGWKPLLQGHLALWGSQACRGPSSGAGPVPGLPLKSAALHASFLSPSLPSVYPPRTPASPLPPPFLVQQVPD